MAQRTLPVVEDDRVINDALTERSRAEGTPSCRRSTDPAPQACDEP